MNLNKTIERTIRFVLDECLPPILRDRRFLMLLPFKLVFGTKAKFFLDFKEKSIHLSEHAISEIYSKTSSVHIQQKGTDLSASSIRDIEANILGNNVLDVGCGNGLLANHLSKLFKVTACDILVDEKTIHNFPDVQFKTANVTNLPFNDGEFDTVICAHTLEHIQNIFSAISELRRVARKRLIIILPKERPYRYTFNLHLHFFPYKYLVVQLFQENSSKLVYNIKEIDGCWYYHEDQDKHALG